MIVDLGVLIKNIPGYDFSMDGFGDRLRLQKTVYLLQAFGIYLGYDFSWYLRGPYCTSLTINGFALNDMYGNIPDGLEAKFQSAHKQGAFRRFRSFIKGKNTDQLEILASLNYLKQTGMSDEDAKSKVEQKQERFTRKDVESMWQELSGQGLA